MLLKKKEAEVALNLNILLWIKNLSKEMDYL
jgi:hypothetical protein